MFRHLDETGALSQPTVETSGASSHTEIGLPEGVREVILRRVSRLSESCNRGLTLASVLGREFDLDVLQAFDDLDRGSAARRHRRSAPRATRGRSAGPAGPLQLSSRADPRHAVRRPGGIAAPSPPSTSGRSARTVGRTVRSHRWRTWPIISSRRRCRRQGRRLCHAGRRSHDRCARA